MHTSHLLIAGDARSTAQLADESVHLIVTSPPYPMVQMWDTLFAAQDKVVANYLQEQHGQEAFEAMHLQLDRVWAECVRVLAPGGIACINIGDATRSIAENFALYPNHARIMQAFTQLNMQCLPLILWRKTTNAPNKFMGSGMLAPGAYVTLEHEYILVFRKGGKRAFAERQEKNLRASSAYFWEERNQWFTDMWQLKGERQQLDEGLDRERSAAFPFELPYRLLNMYSLKGDTVYDPFTGTGTTSLAAIASGRNSIGMDLSKDLLQVAANRIENLDMDALNQIIQKRLDDHRAFEQARISQKGPLKYRNACYGFGVMTRQEQNLYLNPLERLSPKGGFCWEASYLPDPA